jgi:hypothetical protein
MKPIKVDEEQNPSGERVKSPLNALGWHPIESAPKDGTEIIIVQRSSGLWECHSAVYLPRKDAWVSPDGGYGYEPVGWLPRSVLPDPPEA